MFIATCRTLLLLALSVVVLRVAAADGIHGTTSVPTMDENVCVNLTPTGTPPPPPPDTPTYEEEDEDPGEVEEGAQGEYSSCKTARSGSTGGDQSPESGEAPAPTGGVRGTDCPDQATAGRDFIQTFLTSLSLPLEGDCASCGAGPAGVLMPPPETTPRTGMPELLRASGSWRFGVEPFGDQTHAWDLYLTYKTTAGGGRFEIQLPFGTVLIKFNTSDFQTFTYVKDMGRNVPSTLVRSGDDLTLTTDRGEVLRFVLPVGWDWAVGNQRLPCVRMEPLDRGAFDLIYDANQRLQAVQGALGSLTFTWGTIGVDPVITAVATPDGRSTSYAYTVIGGRPRLTTVTHPDGSQDQIAYDLTPANLAGYSFSFITRTALAPNFQAGSGRGRQTTAWIDSRGLVARLEDGSGRALIDRTANGMAGPVHWRRITASNGTTRIVAFNSHGVLTQITNPETGRDHLYGTDNRRRIVRRRDELGRLHTWSYLGETYFLSERTYPDGSSEQWTRDPLTKRALSHTDRRGHTTHYQRNARGQATVIILPDATPGDLSDNPRIQRDFNAIGQLTRRIDELGRITEYRYSPTGDPATAAPSWDHPTNHGFVVQRITPREPSTEASAPVWTYTWNPVTKDLVQVTDPEGRQYAITYDLLHRPIRIDYTDGSHESVTYGAPTGANAGLIVASRDRNGNVTTFAHNLAGQETLRTLPDGQTIATTYDTFGRIASRTALGETTVFTYDAAGRRVATSRQPEAGTTLTETVRYDSQDRPIVRTDAYGRRSFTVYDVNDRPVRSVVELSPAVLPTAAVEAQAAADDVDPTQWTARHIGSGSGSASEVAGVHTVTGSGRDTYGSSDALHFVGTGLEGDGVLIARLSTWAPTTPEARAGLMLRSQDDPQAPLAWIAVTPTDAVFRTRQGGGSGAGSSMITGPAASAGTWLRLERSQATVTGSISTDGITWTTIGSIALVHHHRVSIGFAVTSQHATTSATAVFDNVAVSTHAVAGPLVAQQAVHDYLATLPRSTSGVIITDTAYAANGLVLSRTDGKGNVMTFAYDERDRLISRTEAAGAPEAATTTWSFDAVGNILTDTDPRGTVTAMTYTARNQVATRTRAQGLPEASTIIMTYTPTNRLWTQSDPRNPAWLTVHAYSACCNRLVSIADPLGFITQIDYDAYGNRTSVTDANGLVTTWAYDSRHRPIAMSNAAGETVTMVYDDDLSDGVGLDAAYPASVAGLGFGAGSTGSAQATISPLGEVSLVVRDGLGRTRRQVDGNGHTTTTAYDAVVSGLLETAVTDAVGNVQRVRSDGAGRTTQMVDAAGQLSTAVYDANSNRIETRDPNAVGMDCTFDARNREIVCTDTAGAVTQMSYDDNSNLLSTTDALGQVTLHTYDALNRRTTTTDRVGATTVFAYDAADNLEQITDAEGGVTSYTYDARGLLVQEVFPPGQQTGAPSGPSTDIRQYTYDPGRRLATRTDQAGVVTTYTYDNANRLITREYPDTLDDAFAYDLSGRLTTATSARYGTTVARGYDAASRLTSETQTIQGASATVTYGYDDANRRTTVTYPHSGSVVSESWTARHQLAGVTWNSQHVATRTYDDGGRLVTTTLGNGLVETRTWPTAPGTRENLVSRIHTPGVTDFTYAYDALKRKTQELNGMLPTQSQTFGYDGEGRLTSWEQTDGITPNATQDWTLTPVGDWQQTVRNGVAEPRTHSPVHELLTVNGVSLLYDQKGNLTKDDRGQAYTWDPENRLQRATVPGALGTVATYGYDALGRRLYKTVNGRTTRFWHDGARVVVEQDLPQPVSPVDEASDGDLANQVLTPATGGMLQPTTGSVQRINLQPATTAIPAGYLADKGRVYGTRTNGLDYGWQADATGDTVERVSAVPLQELNTHVRLAPNAVVPNSWRIALPNGSYPVIVVAGDPASTEQTNDLIIGGVAVIDPDPAAPAGYTAGDFDGYAVQVTVTTGELVISAAGTAIDPKLCFIEIGPEGTTVDAAALDRLADLVQEATDATWEPGSSPTEVREYVYGHYVDELLSYVVGAGASPQRYFVHANHLYSIAATTNSGGSVVERYAYDAYGTQTVTNAAGTVELAISSVSQSRGFTGFYEDQETGLLRSQTRPYHTSLGRWIGRDPIGYVDGASLYKAYFSPNGLDPSGMVGFTYNPPGVQNHPYTFVPLGAWGRAKITGTVTCECYPCDDSSTCEKYFMQCNISIESIIEINQSLRVNPNPEPGVTLAGTYGHEQQHVRSVRDEIVKLGEAEIAQTEKRFYCKFNKEFCENAAKMYQQIYQAKVHIITIKESGHSNPASPGEHDDVPPVGGTMPPPSN